MVLDRDRSEELFKFVIRALREDVREDEIWATVEVMSSEDLESSILEGNREIREGRVGRFRTAKEAMDCLRS